MFCEECGAKLEPGIKFCENCGTPVEAESYKGVSNNSVSGVIITNSKLLSQQLGVSESQVLDTINWYSQKRAESGVSYTVVNLADYSLCNDLHGVINLLKKEISSNSFEYLFILGNENVVPFIAWTNESQDGDADVPSDFVYTTLNENSPWEVGDYDFDSVLKVGRLTTWRGESFAQFENYLKNAASWKGATFADIFALSAATWQEETAHEYRRISNKQIECSPDCTRFNISRGSLESANLLLFNVHGSNETPYWYGQEESTYPEAFSPENVDYLKTFNFIGVEACYGARYEDNLTDENSILQRALTTKTLSLLGSSRIAYGCSVPEGSCADIVIPEFLEQLKNGATAGEAHISGLKKLYSTDVSDSDIKTLCEFALYGDPSLKFLAGTPESKKMVGKSLVSHINVPDVRKAVRLSLAVVNSKIAEQINNYVYERYDDMKNVVPKNYKCSNSGLYQSIYINSSKRVVKVYFDSNGTIRKELLSKQV